MISHRWAFIVCPKKASNKGSEAIVQMAACRGCRPYFKGFYETGVKCEYEYLKWCELQGLNS